MTKDVEKIMMKTPQEIAEIYEDAYAVYKHYENRKNPDERSRKLCREYHKIAYRLEQESYKIGYVFDNGKAYTKQEWAEHEKETEKNSVRVHW